MSELHVRQLEQYFQNTVVPYIDISDLAGKAQVDIEKSALSRALTAFSLNGLTGDSVTNTAKYVIDGKRDQGIDGFYYDAPKNTLVFVQSKWHGNGTKTIGKGDILKFLRGIKLVLSANWTEFSPKFQAHKTLIEGILLKPDVSVIVAVAFTGDNKLGEECEECLSQFENEQNSVSDFLEVKVLDLRALHRFFRNLTLAAQPPFNAMLLDWGQSIQPYNAVYGRICCEELAKLYSVVGEPLFEPNIRSFLGDGEVNSQIINTLISKPDEFWYLNNGITAICTKYSKTALGGGDNRQAGTFIFEGLQVVNGAQTIGSIAKAYEKSSANVAKAFAMIKVISLEGTPLGFADVITIATNRQNKVEEKDFLSLDQNQNRVKNELASKQIQYVYRSGESVVDRNSGFDVTEAIVALACSSSDIDNAVVAKRNIGILLDRKSSNYQGLFNTEIIGTNLWDKVQELRRIDQTLLNLQKIEVDSKKKQIYTHGNRILTWSVFNSGINISSDNQDALDAFVAKSVDAVDYFLKEKYPDSYLAIFFKNQQKCNELGHELRSKLF